MNSILSRVRQPAGRTILIVDDTPINLGVIVESLAGHGFRVVVAQDGEEGIQRADFAQPDLILLDVMMPGLNGFEVCRRLKADARTRHIPVIFMTALSDTEDKVAGFEAGGVDYVTKPLQIDEVAARVGTHLRLDSLQKQLEAQNAQLHKYRERLEQQVAERTAELTESNRRLREEIAERRQAEARLRESEQRYLDMFNNISDGVFLLEVSADQRFKLIDFNPIFEKVAGGPRQPCIGKYIDEVLPESMLAQVLPQYRRCLESGKPVEYAGTFELPGGEWREFAATVIPVRDGSGRIHRLTGLSRDVTALKRYELLLHKREQEFRGLAENSPDTIARYDRECRRIYANPKMMAAMGGDAARILGTTPSQVPGGASALEYEKKIREVFASGEERDFELRWPAPHGEACTHIRMSPEFDLTGEVAQVLAVGRDISEIDQYRKKVHQQAFYDSLTGLPNRLMFSERVQQAMSGGVHAESRFSLVILDLDNFKEVNDILGHGTGDRLLCETGRRLQAVVRACDTVARLGGDEFALLLPDMDGSVRPPDVAGAILQTLAEPFLLNGREFVVTASLGLARYPEDSTDIDGLYKHADLAMYHAKEQGRNNFQFYTKGLTEQAAERLEMDGALRRAQKNGELELYYQPQVDMPSGRITGAEALLRWNRPGHGVVSPDRFIPVAEASGLIVDIGEWVLARACEAAVAWNRDRAQPLAVAVNLSTRQFIRNDLLGSITRVLAETGCKPEWLKLEITESLLLEDSQAVTSALQAFVRMGLSISIDDFGTGYSALSYLHRFPVSQLKIDRSFVCDILSKRDKSELVKAMLSIASALHMETVAEGVETQAQADYLIAYGCSRAQGYLYGKPMPHAEFDGMLRQTERNAEA